MRCTIIHYIDVQKFSINISYQNCSIPRQQHHSNPTIPPLPTHLLLPTPTTPTPLNYIHP